MASLAILINILRAGGIIEGFGRRVWGLRFNMSVCLLRENDETGILSFNRSSVSNNSGTGFHFLNNFQKL